MRNIIGNWRQLPVTIATKSFLLVNINCKMRKLQNSTECIEVMWHSWRLLLMWCECFHNGTNSEPILLTRVSFVKTAVSITDKSRSIQRQTIGIATLWETWIESQPVCRAAQANLNRFLAFSILIDNVCDQSRDCIHINHYQPFICIFSLCIVKNIIYAVRSDDDGIN